MRVRLLLTCLCDAFYGDVGVATVRALEHAGCTVSFPDEQTCCGQPPYNNGDWETAKAVAERCRKVFAGDEPIVTPSSSCAAMLHEGYAALFPGSKPMPIHELSDFLINQMGVEHWPMSGDPKNKPYKISFHRACHGRALGLGDVQERLISHISNVAMLPLADPEQCCGFGGSFSVSQSGLSTEIGQEKLRRVADSKPDLLVSGDMGCLMHLKGLLARTGSGLKAVHYAQLLSEAIG